MVVARSVLPLELTAEVTTADGARFRWGANEPAQSRLRNFSFGTKIGEGFSQGQGQLPRRFDLDYPDLSLVDTITFVGADGSVAYEGRNSAMPRELSDTASIGVTLAGWMAHASERKFTEIYVDRDQAGWGGPSARRKAYLLTNGFTPHDPESSPDPTNNQAQLSTVWTGGWVAYKPSGEAWYDAGPAGLIGRVGYGWKRTNTTNMALPPGDPNWTWLVVVASDDNATAQSDTGNLVAAGPVALQTFTATTPYRYAALIARYGATGVSAEGTRWGIDWSKLAVYGAHGLPLHTGDPGEPAGVYASDVIRDIARRYCPRLDPSGVVDSSYVIQHLAFKDRVTPFDALQQVNKYHLFNLAVWEDRTLHWSPFDLTDYTWQVRTDQVGTSFQAQGPSVDTVFNGIVVSYADLLTGTRNVLTPDAYPELRDTDPTNPWNRHGIDRWDELELSYPHLQADALQAGRAALADRNRPKSPGQITVKGYIQDRAGNRQPGWKVRAGETVAITDHPNDAPRLIHETGWDDEAKTLTITVDGPPSILDAQLDRVTTALKAAGLTS